MKKLLIVLVAALLTACATFSVFATKTLADVQIGDWRVQVLDKPCTDQKIKDFAVADGAQPSQADQMKEARVTGPKDVAACVYILSPDAGIIVDEQGGTGLIPLKKD